MSNSSISAVNREEEEEEKGYCCLIFRLRFNDITIKIQLQLLIRKVCGGTKSLH